MASRLFAGLLWLGAGTALSACGGAGSTEPSVGGLEDDDGEARSPAGGGSAPADADGGSRGRAVAIAMRRVPTGLDPLGDLEPWAQRVADDLVFDALVRRTGDRHPFVEPALADECFGVPEAAPKNVYCRLRSGVQFHDGEPVTADDVVYSLSWWLDPRRSSTRQRLGLGSLRRVEIAETLPGRSRDASETGRWIVVGFETPEPLALERIAEMKVVPVAKHRGRASSFARNPIGTGPMQLVTVEPDRWVLEPAVMPEREAGDATWPRTVDLDRIVLRAIPDGAEALTSLRRGDVHMLAEVAPVHLPRELTKPGMAARFEAWLLTPARYDIVLYNLRRGPQAGPRLREALDLAAPRIEVARLHSMPPQRAGGGPLRAPIDLHDPTPIDLEALRAAGVTATWGMAGLPDPLDADRAEQDLAEATAILDGLGWTLERGVRRRAGSALRLVLMWDGERGEGAKMAAAVRDTWRTLGVQVPYATASWAYVYGLMRKGEYDLGLVRLAERSDADLHPYFHSRGELNLTGIADAELDAALEAFRGAPDRATRQQAKGRIAERLATLRPVTVLYAPTEVMLVSRRLGSLQFVDDLPMLDRMELGPDSRWLSDE
jgi:ABC-type transport system substrate-binding protein